MGRPFAAGGLCRGFTLGGLIMRDVTVETIARQILYALESASIAHLAARVMDYSPVADANMVESSIWACIGRGEIVVVEADMSATSNHVVTLKGSKS